MRAVVNGKSVGGALPALIDSGSTLVIGPAASVEAFYAALSTPTVPIGQGQYAFKAAPLKAGFSFGSKAHPLDDDDMCRARKPRAWWEDNGVALPEDGDWCLGAITAQDSLNADKVDTGVPIPELDHWLVGNIFMQNVYTAYRADPPAVGFAPLTPEANRKYPSETGETVATTTVGPDATGAVSTSGARKSMPSFALLVAALAMAW